MFATHLWVRAAAVMSGGAEEPSPVKAFLSPLNLVEYRNLLKDQGYDDPGPGVIMIVPMRCPGPTSRRARGRQPGVGTHPAAGRPRGRPGVGTHSGSALPRYDIHYESPGVPDPAPSSGFRDRYMRTPFYVQSHDAHSASMHGRDRGRGRACARGEH